jgi:hypothetical protein
MYGGNAKSVYVACVSDLTQKLARAGHISYQVSMTNESLITRARNTLAHEFLKSDADALLFIDGDHGFNVDDIIKMVNSGKDVIGAVYPMKSINWENVRKAALAGKENLELYSGFFAVNFLPESQSFKGDEPFKVRDIGTGMLFIHRRAFEQVKPLVKTYRNNAAHANIEMGERIHEFFPTMITEEPEAVLLSEDYAFCHLYRESGGDVYAAPWVRISHAGEYNFSGNFLATLEIQQQYANIDAPVEGAEKVKGVEDTVSSLRNLDAGADSLPSSDTTDDRSEKE